MNIPLKMNRDFEKAMTTLNERYGEDFEYLNGFHETQLNFSDFIDGFIDKNVADGPSMPMRTHPTRIFAVF